MKDSSERFTAVADAYDRFRPGYPSAVLDWLVATTDIATGARMADLGCGTGIFSRLVAARGFAVVGIDPNAEMLAVARKAGGGPAYVMARATCTGLVGGSVHLVTAAQAFHWFPREAALAEVDRILAPGGWACALWNLRVSSPFNEEYHDLMRTWSTDYRADLSDLHHDPRAPLVDAALPGAVTVEFPAQEALRWDAVIGRVRSMSYVVHGVADRRAFEERVRQAFERHARADRTLVWAMRTAAIAWPRRG
jgi:SAM-dependent methyltransferase